MNILYKMRFFLRRFGVAIKDMGERMSHNKIPCHDLIISIGLSIRDYAGKL